MGSFAFSQETERKAPALARKAIDAGKLEAVWAKA